MLQGPVGSGIPNAYPLAIVPGHSKEECDHITAVQKAEKSEPCDHCAFRKNVSWRNPRIAAMAIERARNLKLGTALICHRSAEIKNDEYVKCEHSNLCAGALRFRLATMRVEKSNDPLVFHSADAMLAYHAEEAQ